MNISSLGWPQFSGRLCYRNLSFFLRWICRYFLWGGAVCFNITRGSLKWWVKPPSCLFNGYFPVKKVHLATPPLASGNVLSAEDGKRFGVIKFKDLKKLRGGKMVAWTLVVGEGSPPFLQPNISNSAYLCINHQIPYTCPTLPVLNFPLRWILYQYWHAVMEATVKQLLKDSKAIWFMTSYCILVVVSVWGLTLRFSSVRIRGFVSKPPQNKYENQPAFPVYNNQ